METNAPPNGPPLYLVALSDGPAAAGLLRRAAALSAVEGAGLIALHVARPGDKNSAAAARLQRLAGTANELGIEFAMITEAGVGRGIARYARERSVSRVIAGRTRRGPLAALFGDPLKELEADGGPFQILLLPDAPSSRGKKRHFLPLRSARFPALQYGAVLLATALVTLANYAIAPWAGYRSIALFYLLFVTFSALVLRVGPVVLAAAASALLWNYLFIPPLHTLSIARLEDLLMFLVYFVNAVLIGGLTARLRARKQALQSGEKKITALYNLSRELGQALDRDGIVLRGVKYIDGYFRGGTAVLLGDESAALCAHPAGTLALTEDEQHEARAVFAAARSAERRPAPSPSSRTEFVLLGSGAVPIGVLGIRPETARPIGPDDATFARNAGYLVSLALERETLLRRSEAARVSAESERLYKTLFSLISHELRTPLTTIQGAASSLDDGAVDGRPETRRALYREIKKAGDRLNRLFSNLLSMGRIESGFLRLNRRPQDLRDILSAARNALGDELHGVRLTIDVADDLPACPVDFDFFEQVCVNLLNNAALYAGNGAAIRVSARPEGEAAVIRFEDDGPGFPPAALPGIFGKFRRGDVVRAGGLGLGLSICKSIVEAHGGTITAANGAAGGAAVTVVLPLQVGEKPEPLPPPAGR